MLKIQTPEIHSKADRIATAWFKFRDKYSYDFISYLLAKKGLC